MNIDEKIESFTLKAPNHKNNDSWLNNFVIERTATSLNSTEFRQLGHKKIQNKSIFTNLNEISRVGVPVPNQIPVVDHLRNGGHF